MKYAILLILLSFSLMSVTAQENFKWKEMNDFHSTAMTGFHSAEISKLEPVRDSASSVLEKAKEWQSSVVPPGCKSSVIKPLLQTLVEECQSILEAVNAKKPDKALQPLVEKAHNTFHLIIHKCK